MMAAANNYTTKQIKEYLLLAAQPTPTGNLHTMSHTGNLVNARAAVLAFGDSLNDFAAQPVSRFFSDLFTETGNRRWAVAQNGASLCDTPMKVVAGTLDHAAEVEFTNLSSWTIAAWANSYPPGAQRQTTLIRIETPDSADFSGRHGRIGVGLVGDTGSNPKNCPMGVFQKPYIEMTFGGSVFGGIELTSGTPYISFSPPFTDITFSPINLSGVRKLSIAVGLDNQTASLSISNSITGESLFFQDNISYPSVWNWTGTDKGAFMYWGGLEGGSSGTNRLLVKSFLSVR